MTRTRTRRAGALILGLALVATACGSDEEDTGSTSAPVTTTGGTTAATTADTTAETTADTTEETTAQTTEETTGDTATDGTSGSGAGSGELVGFKGTTPLTELSSDFQAKLKEMDPELIDFNYAAETYDAVTIIALAVEKAGDDGIAHASEIIGITRDGETCTDFVSCKEILDAGGDPDYDGVSGRVEFNGVGDPLTASYGVLSMGEDNRIDNAQTTYLPAEAAADADVAVVPVEGTREGDGVLKLGTLLPITGSLAFLGPPEFAGFDLAIQEINDAGGVLGKPIESTKGDSGDTPEFANVTVDSLLGENVDAIIGAAASGITLGVIDKVTGAGITMFSPANTSDKLTTYADKGLYFRTAPPDLLQGPAIAKLIADDGATNVAIIARNDAYGTGLADVIQASLAESGIEVGVVKIYEPDAGTFDAEVAEIKGASPDAIAVIGFEESSKILRTLVENGLGPNEVPTYGCDGNTGNALGESFESGE